MLRQYLSFALLAAISTGCATNRPDPVPPVPFEQSVVQTSSDAIAIALRFMQENDWTEGYDFDSAEAREEPASWVVNVPRIAQTLPPASVIVVSKLDGTAEAIPTR